MNTNRKLWKNCTVYLVCVFIEMILQIIYCFLCVHVCWVCSICIKSFAIFNQWMCSTKFIIIVICWPRVDTCCMIMIICFCIFYLFTLKCVQNSAIVTKESVKSSIFWQIFFFVVTQVPLSNQIIPVTNLPQFFREKCRVQS